MNRVGPAESPERCRLWLNDAVEMSPFQSINVINRPFKLLHRLKMLPLSAHGICARRDAEKMWESCGEAQAFITRSLQCKCNAASYPTLDDRATVTMSRFDYPSQINLLFALNSRVVPPTSPSTIDNASRDSRTAHLSCEPCASSELNVFLY